MYRIGTPPLLISGWARRSLLYMSFVQLIFLHFATSFSSQACFGL